MSYKLWRRIISTIASGLSFPIAIYSFFEQSWWPIITLFLLSVGVDKVLAHFIDIEDKVEANKKP